MKKVIYIITGIFLIGFFSCNKESLLINNLKEGAFVYFTHEPNAVLGINSIQELNFSGELNSTESVASYELKVFGTLAVLNGGNTDTVTMGTYNSFPVTLDISADDFVSLLDSIKDVNDINFGDSFTFIGSLTDVEGNVYYGKAPEVEYTETDTTFVANGLTNEEVFDRANGYKDGFDFGFTIGCPPNSFNADEIAGTWTEEANLFKDILGIPYGTVTIVAGPEENQITFINGDIPDAGSEDLIIEVDPETNGIFYAGSPDAVHAFGVVYGGVEGTIFGCAGKMNITIHSPGFIDNIWVLSKSN